MLLWLSCVALDKGLGPHLAQLYSAFNAEPKRSRKAILHPKCENWPRQNEADKQNGFSRFAERTDFRVCSTNQHFWESTLVKVMFCLKQRPCCRADLSTFRQAIALNIVLVRQMLPVHHCFESPTYGDRPRSPAFFSGDPVTECADGTLSPQEDPKRFL